MSIPGLPDTTNIQDAQLRLYLDRLNNIFGKIVATVNSIENNVDIKSILSGLSKDPEFLSFIQKEATKIAKTEADKAIALNEKIKKSKDKVLEYITVIPAGLNIKPGEAFEALEVVYYPDNILNYQRGVTWSSSDETIATVDENGKVTTYANGQCVITATSTYNTNITADCYVYVAEEYTIFINAVYEWVSIEGYSIYTEKSFPIANDTVWNTNAEITVTVPADITEAEAKIQASAGIVSNTDERSFIVTEESKRYWRDTEKDVSESENYDPIRLYSVGKAAVFDWDSVNGHYVNSGFSYLANEDKTVAQLFSKWSTTSSLSNEQKAEYSFAKCRIAENIQLMEAKDVPVNVFCWIDQYYLTDNPEGSDVNLISKRSYVVETGRKKTLNGYNDEKYGNEFIEVTNLDGDFACWINAGVFTKNELLRNETLDIFGYVGDVYLDDAGIVDGTKGVAYVFGSYDESVKYFKYEDVWYVCDTYSTGYVFDVGSGWSAWSLSPAVGDETVYTVSEEAPDKYGTLNENNTFEEKGKVADTGNGVYSITVNDETVYYSAEYGV